MKLNRMIKLLFLIEILSVFGASGVLGQSLPAFQKVTIIVLENVDYSKAVAQPFLKQFAKNGALLADLAAATHPSQGNYFALTAGSTYGVKSNRPINLDVRHIGDLLEEKNLTWKMYAEDYPGNCFLKAAYKQYSRKHAPFISYKNVQKNPERCAKIVNGKEFDKDIADGTLPNYSLYIPNDHNNGHDTGVAYADRWLAKRFGPLLKDPNFMKDMLVIITFDENGGRSGNKIYTALYGDSIKAGTVSKQSYNLYSILRTIQDAWGLETLKKYDAGAKSINDIWK